MKAYTSFRKSDPRQTHMYGHTEKTYFHGGCDTHDTIFFMPTKFAAIMVKSVNQRRGLM